MAETCQVKKSSRKLAGFATYAITEFDTFDISGPSICSTYTPTHDPSYPGTKWLGFRYRALHQSCFHGTCIRAIAIAWIELKYTSGSSRFSLKIRRALAALTAWFKVSQCNNLNLTPVLLSLHNNSWIPSHSSISNFTTEVSRQAKNKSLWHLGPILRKQEEVFQCFYNF